MKPIFGVYDKSQRNGRYLLFFSESDEPVAIKAYQRFIEGATDGFHHDLAKGIRWPSLHGGLVIVDFRWACVYRFVEAKDLAANPRPLNVILMALVRREDIVNKDWRGVLTCSAFYDLAERLKRGDRGCPESCEEAVVLADSVPPSDVVAALEAGAEPEGFPDSAVCAAVASMSPERHANLVVSGLRGGERLRLHMEDGPLPRNAALEANKESESPRRDEATFSTRPQQSHNTRGSEADYSVAWMQLQRFLVFVGAPAAVLIGVLTLWGPSFTDWWREPPFKRGDWYVPEAYAEGNRVFYDLVKAQEGNLFAFEMRSRYRDDPVELVSKSGEKRSVPRDLIRPRPLMQQPPNNQPIPRPRRGRPANSGPSQMPPEQEADLGTDDRLP